MLLAILIQLLSAVACKAFNFKKPTDITVYACCEYPYVVNYPYRKIH